MIQLDFKVCPEYLAQETEVLDAVKIVITEPEAVFVLGILGESGRKMVEAGTPFYFTRRIAEKLIAADFAVPILGVEGMTAAEEVKQYLFLKKVGFLTCRE